MDAIMKGYFINIVNKFLTTFNFCTYHTNFPTSNSFCWSTDS